eukprot:CAMPEP_0185733200 /NCGR_PEP_ID=MMETSP1171-20130828/18736_1 /TAXON_ID=374046 /ORGANISM="Helicotheca tamensis, Strain CCMP826" /LENGTH=684 /DNA_ID=CAMNT_0028402857 /DNA_START=111 /DNA_END=2165 /DNA_ORIENTATION=-
MEGDDNEPSSTEHHDNAMSSSPYRLHSSPNPPQRRQRQKHADDDQQHTGDDDDEYSSDDDDYSEEEEEEEEMSIKELMYAANSYHTIAKPVTITMILAALAVIFINTQTTIEQGAAQMASTYYVFSLDTSSDSKTTTLAKSFINTLVMVSAICTMTFGIVLLYKFRCMKLLIGYMIFSSATLLGVLGGVMLEVAVDKYRIPMDVFSFVFGLYNFALVGIIAVFYQRGVPSIVTRAYLVATSVILSWQLSHFDDWTAWTLLIMLALYDLCAVLTPCGPLKALVNLMSRDDAPEMPGLLYEAELPSTSNRQQQNQQQQLRSLSQIQQRQKQREQTISSTQSLQHSEPAVPASSDAPNAVSSSLELPAASQTSPDITSYGAAASPSQSTTPDAVGAAAADTTTLNDSSQIRTVTIPLAIAKIYKLPLTRNTAAVSSTARNESKDKKKKRRSHRSRDTTSSILERTSSGVSTSPLLEDKHSVSDDDDDDVDKENVHDLEDQHSVAARGVGVVTPEDITHIDPSRNYTPKELKSLVNAILPSNGGRIEKLSSSGRRHNKMKYAIYDRHGALKRVLFVNREGKVFEEVQHGDDDSEDEDMEANSIKLGLGDFIFYSVLVGKAAQHSFTTFISCILVILAGLGGTLVLLSVFRQALPALPISIFLGVAFYLMTRLCVEPWVKEVLNMPFYV